MTRGCTKCSSVRFGTSAGRPKKNGSVAKAAYSQTEIQLAICLKEGDRHIGNVHLTEIDWVSRHAEVGIFIGETQHRSNGYGQQALRLLLRHAFHDLGLHRVYLTVLDDNQRAIRAYEKCGFVVEGKLRRHAYKRGQFRDLIFMGVCVGDPGGEWAQSRTPARRSPVRRASRTGRNCRTELPSANQSRKDMKRILSLSSRAVPSGSSRVPMTCWAPPSCGLRTEPRCRRFEPSMPGPVAYRTGRAVLNTGKGTVRAIARAPGHCQCGIGVDRPDRRKGGDPSMRTCSAGYGGRRRHAGQEAGGEWAQEADASEAVHGPPGEPHGEEL